MSTDRADAGTNGNDPPGPTESNGSDPTGSPNDRSPRIDTPPYEITEPACGDEAHRDTLWLCTAMPAEPSIDFDQVATSTLVFANEGLRVQGQAATDEYYATMLLEVSRLDRLHDEASQSVVEFLAGTAFDSHVVLAAQTGLGSGSKTPHLKRIEATSPGIHAFGCLRQPCAWTDDYSHCPLSSSRYRF